MNPKIRFAALVLSVGLQWAQTGPTVSATGYVDPSWISLAPGQITTLFLTGVKIPTSARATGFPLPTTLGGLSVSLRQFTNVDPVPVPLISAIVSRSGCAPEQDSCSRVALTIQVPYGLDRSTNVLPNPNSLREIVVSENGVPGPPVAFAPPLVQRIHVVTNCDPITPFPYDEFFYFNQCNPFIQHANGALLSDVYPAESGETLAIYAYGLGETSPSIPAGTPAPTQPAVATYPTQVAFIYAPNVGPTFDFRYANLPSFAGLVPGYAGLYQINFVVPTPPPGTSQCHQPGTNFTMTLIGSENYDWVGFCVQVAPASAQSQGGDLKRR